MSCDEKLPQFGIFTVVEETTLTRIESSEDSTNIDVTWGKLKLKATDPMKHRYTHMLNEDVNNESETIENKNKFRIKSDVNEMSNANNDNYEKLNINTKEHSTLIEDINNDALNGIKQDIVDEILKSANGISSNGKENNNSKNKNYDDSSDDDIRCTKYSKIHILENNPTSYRNNSVIISEIEDCFEISDEEFNCQNISPVIEDDFDETYESLKDVNGINIIFEEINEEELEEKNLVDERELKQNIKNTFNNNLKDKTFFNFSSKIIETAFEEQEEFISEVRKLGDDIVDISDNELETNNPNLINNVRNMYQSDIIEAVNEYVNAADHPEKDSDKTDIYVYESLNIIPSAGNDVSNEIPSAQDDKHIETEIETDFIDNLPLTTSYKEELDKSSKIEETTSNPNTPHRTILISLLFCVFLFLSLYILTPTYPDNHCEVTSSKEQQSACTLEGYVELSRISGARKN